MDYEISLELLKQLEENYKIYIVKEAYNTYNLIDEFSLKLSIVQSMATSIIFISDSY